MSKLPTIRGVNWLYVLTMVLIVTAGSALQSWSPTWGLVATEWLLILPSALIYLALARLPAATTLRLRWPGGLPALLSLVVGIGAAFLALWLGNQLTILFGYSYPVPPGLLPTNLSQAVVVYFAMAISAPICEETLFRGVIQRGYERRGPWAGILAGGLLFAFYHLSPQRLLALVPVALALGYVAWRSSSLISSMLVHFSYNTLVVLLLIVNSMRPDLNLDIMGSLPAALLGSAVALAALWWLNRTTRLPAEEQPAPETSSWLGRALPLAFASLVFLSLGSLEIIVGRFPQMFATSQVEFMPSAWQEPVQWEYELRNVLDQPVGNAKCSLATDGTNYRLDCDIQQQAFNVKKGSSQYQTDAYTYHQTARWDQRNLNLVGAQGSQQGDKFSLEYTVQPSGGGLDISVSQNGGAEETLPIPANALLMGEWPWRLSALPFTTSNFWKTTLVWPSRWSPEANHSLPTAQDQVVSINGAEPVSTPAGNFIAWKVVLGDQTAWYDSQPPHTLVRYDDGLESYLLVK